MALTSAQIRTMLKPMMDFSPAILRAAEIIEAAEHAEQTFDARREEQANELANGQRALQEIEVAKRNAQDKLDQLLADVEQASVTTIATRKELAESIREMQVQHGQVEQEWKLAQQTHTNRMALLEEEIRGQESLLAQRKAALAEFMRTLPK